MKAKYDPDADALYIYLSEKIKPTRTEEVRENMVLDFAGDKLVGIEILEASDRISKNTLDSIVSTAITSI